MSKRKPDHTLDHWLSLSAAQRQGLSALAHEIDTASLLMENSMDRLSTLFMELAGGVRQQINDVNALVDEGDQPDLKDRLRKTSETSRQLSQNISEIMTAMQFQDRTSQRLGHTSAALLVIVDMLGEMEKESCVQQGTDKGIEPDRVWIEQMIRSLHLEEMRERFIKHTLLDPTCEQVENKASGGDVKVEHAEASDDIELF